MTATQPDSIPARLDTLAQQFLELSAECQSLTDQKQDAEARMKAVKKELDALARDNPDQLPECSTPMTLRAGQWRTIQDPRLDVETIRELCIEHGVHSALVVSASKAKGLSDDELHQAGMIKEQGPQYVTFSRKSEK